MRPVSIETYIKNPNEDNLAGLGLLIKEIGIESASNEFYENYKCVLHGYEETQEVLNIKFNDIKLKLGESFFHVQRLKSDDLICYSYFYCADEEYYEGDIYHDIDSVKDVKAWFLSVIKEYLYEYYKKN